MSIFQMSGNYCKVGDRSQNNGDRTRRYVSMYKGGMETKSRNTDNKITVFVKDGEYLKYETVVKFEFIHP